MQASQRTRRVLLALCALVGVLTLAGAAAAADVGANDDTGKYSPDGGAAFYARMAQTGLRQTIVTVRWQPSDPLAVPEAAMLRAAVTSARATGLDVVFAVYPYPPREIEAGLAKPAAFASWLGALARAFPEVRQYVVGNEPNQPAFFRPQFSRGAQVSARRFGPFLAAGYDALKAVDPTITVVGVGLSPRGNDRPNARSNVSTSPVRFLAALGRWYRASTRTRPLMDGFSFHPYPNRATDPLSRGYAWPNAGFANLARIKQALYDAFAGTAQPTTVDGLRLFLDEVGWQVDTEGLEGYEGVENVPVTTEDAQATVYGELVGKALCDPDIAEVNFFGFYDDRVRSGFQSALHRVDGTPRASAEIVRAAIAAGACAGAPVTWTPATRVVGVLKPSLTSHGATWRVDVRAGEGAAVTACALPGRPTPLQVEARMSAAAPGVQCAVGAVTGVAPARLVVPRVAGRHVVAVRLVAETNATRTALVTRAAG